MGFLLFGVFVWAAPAEAAYYKQGIVLSTNMLSGATGVTAIASVTVTATLPTNTTAKIKYSQNNVNFYNAAGTSEGYDTIAAGTNTINISTLGWSDSIFYYKIELGTTDSAATPVISDVQVNYTGSATPDPSATRYQYQGTLLSTNVLSGTSNVTAISSVTVTATLPGGATVKIKYSQDNVNFYNAAGTADGWDTVAAGTNAINVSALGWTGEIFYYKLQWTSIDNATTPTVSDVQVDYTGDAATSPNCSSGCYVSGALVSTDLMSGIEHSMRGTEYFFYSISYLPGGSTVTAQFSQDGTNWYSAAGVLWGATTLSSGEHTKYATALSLASLNWKDGTSFYYKLNLSTTDNTQVPVITAAGLLFAQMTTLSGPQNTTNVNGLVGLWSFDGKETTWASSTTGTTSDSSVNSHTGTLTNMSQTGSIATGQIGQAFDFDGTDDYVSVADNAALDFGDTADFSFSGWFYRDTFTTDDTIFAKRNGIVSTDTGYIAYIDDATDKLVFEVSDGTDEYSLTSTSTFTTTGWYHYAIVWDQDSASGSEIYINGVANGATDSGTIGNIGDLSNAVVLALGAESDAGNPFDGKMDEMRLYNRALSATEIQSLYTFGQSDKVNSSVSQPQGTGRLDSGLFSYWKLDENTGTSAGDSSTNGNTGTLTNGPTWTTGQIGSAVNFDGTDDYVTAGSASTYSFVENTGIFAFSVWIKLDNPSADNAYTIADSTNGASANKGFMLLWDNRTIASAVKRLTGLISRGVGGTWVYYVTTPSNTITDTNWHHIVFSADGADAHMYVDGVLVESVAKTGALPSGDMTAAMKIGVLTGGVYPFDGKIDSFRIYNRSLSTDEVAQLYRLTTPTGVDTSLKGYWSFNGKDLSGTTAYDRSGAGKNGTLVSGPTVTEGKLGQGLLFDGTDDYTSVSSTFGLGTTNVTIALWAYIPSLPAKGAFIKVGSSATGYGIGISNGTTTGFETSGSNLTVLFEGVRWIPTGVSPGTGWHHFALVIDGSGVPTVYKDGASVGSFAGTSALSPVTITQIGGYTSTVPSNRFFSGKVDETRVYNRALSATEIAALYNSSR